MPTGNSDRWVLYQAKFHQPITILTVFLLFVNNLYLGLSLFNWWWWVIYSLIYSAMLLLQHVILISNEKRNPWFTHEEKSNRLCPQELMTINWSSFWSVASRSNSNFQSLVSSEFLLYQNKQELRGSFSLTDVRKSLLGSKHIIIKSQTFQFESSQPHLSTWHWAALYPWCIWFVLEPNLINYF